VDYLQTNISTAAAHQSPSPRPSTTTLDSSDGEELGAWIYMNWRRTKTLEWWPNARLHWVDSRKYTEEWVCSSELL